MAAALAVRLRYRSRTMYSRLGRPRWGSVAAVTALTVDGVDNALLRAAAVVRRRPRRVPQSGTAAGGPTFIRGGRVLGRASRLVPRLARRVETRRRLDGRATLERCYAAHALACLVIAVLAALAKTSAATPAIQLRFVLVVLGLIAATFYRYSWSFLQTRPPVERDIFLMASDAVQATQDALRRLISTHGEATSLIDVEAQPDLAQRFLARPRVGQELLAVPTGKYHEREPRAPSPTQDDAFSLLLRLFAHEDVVDQLRTALMADRTALLFYALQLSTFVLFGAYRDGDRMRDLLLDLCASDLAFAHRVAFYLRAFADSSDLSPGLNLTAAGEGGRRRRRGRGPGDARLCSHADARGRAHDNHSELVATSIGTSARPSCRGFVAEPRPSCHERRSERSGISGRRLLEESRARPLRRGAGVLYERSVPLLVWWRSSARLLRQNEALPRRSVPIPRPSSSERAARGGSARSVEGASRGLFRDVRSLIAAAQTAALSHNTWGAPRRRRGGAAYPQSPPVVFRERWSETRSRLLHARNHALVPIIVKARDDLRQEQFASQLIKACALTLDNEKIPVRLPAYDVVATGPDSA